MPSRSATSLICGPANEVFSSTMRAPHLARSEHRLEKAAVVAGQDRHALAGLEPVLAPCIGQRIGALVELLVAQLAPLVDHHRPVAVAQRAGHDRAAEQAVALEAEQQLGDTVGRLGSDSPLRMHSAAKYASSPARSASLPAPSIRPLGSSAALMMAFGSRLTMGLSSLSGFLGKVPPRSGVVHQ